MQTRRWFTSCALCAAIGFAASDAGAQGPPAGGVRRTILQKTDLPGNDKYIIVQVLGEIEGGATVARHTHPGVETAMIVEGSGVLQVKGQPDRELKVGDTFQIPYEVPHGLQNGKAVMKISSNYVVEKDKPLASPAPA